jgi:hypothetical protein
MIRSFAVAFITIVVVVLFSARAEIAAQQPAAGGSGPGNVPIQFTGGTPGVNLELYVNAGKVADVTISANGTGASILEISNLGKVQLQVYIDVCQDGKTVRVLVVAGQPKPEDNCKRRIVGAAWWSDCGVTRITIDLTKFGMRVIGCGSYFTNPKTIVPTVGALGLIPVFLAGGGDSNTTFVSTPITTTTTSTTGTTTTTNPPVTNPPVTNPPVTNPPVTNPAPVDYTVNLTTSYNHPGGSTSLACGLIITSPALNQSGSYTGQITGPGVVSGGSFSGSLNAAGRAAFQAVINAFGSYSFSVTVSYFGQTRTATGSVNVIAANANCQQP